MARPKQTKAKQTRTKNGTGKAKSKAAKPERKKLTAEELSDQERQKLLFAHKRRVKPLAAEKDRVSKELTAAYEAAKKEGITRKEIDFALKLETDEGEEAIRSDMERMTRVARWMGVEIGGQADMGFPKQSQSDKAFEDGRRAALNDEPAKAPGHLSQQMQQRWLSGHAQGRTELNTERASGFKPLGETVADIASKVAPEPIGTEPATHDIAA